MQVANFVERIKVKDAITHISFKYFTSILDKIISFVHKQNIRKTSKKNLICITIHSGDI